MSPRRFEFELPPRRRWSTWAIAISVIVHGMVFFARIYGYLPPSRLPPSLIVLEPPGSEGSRAVDLPFREPGGAAKRGRAAGITPRPQQETTPTPEPAKPVQTLPDGVVVTRPEPADSVGPPVAAPPSRVIRIGPALGEGKLWVRPLPAPPRELVEALTKSHLQLVDSAVAAIVQEYIDSVLSAPSAPGAKLPSWTTQIFGKTFGLDSKYIYLGGLKIPSAVLALLPIKGGGTQMEFSQANRLAAIREDLQYAAQRAQTMEDFKKAIRELRAERERLHELEKNQKLKPEKKDTAKAPIAPSG